MIDRPQPTLYKRDPLHKGIDMPPEIKDILGNPKYGWIQNSLHILMLNPSLSITRQYFSDALWRMYNEFEEIKTQSDFTNDDIYNHVQYLESILTIFGFCTKPQIETMKPEGGRKGEHLKLLIPTEKYKPYDELKVITQAAVAEGKAVGIVQGCFDPPQVGHVHNAAELYPYCDIVLFGFNKNSQLQEAKGADRPRFPQLAWRMWEVASLPSVDYVFVLPTTSYHAGEEYTLICKDLGVTVMGAGHDNPLLPIYQERMQRLGGKVIAHEYPWSGHSSTFVMKHITNPNSVEATIPRMILDAQVEGLDAYARNVGYLRDYPNGT
jgi:nicotinic acid mononucleotide adenylyltransferase